MANDLFSQTISKETFTEYIRDFEFEELFIELGWDRFDGKLTLKTEDHTYVFKGIVEKRGFAIFQCIPEDGARFPKASERDKLDRQLTRHHNEHLVIYSDQNRKRQLWEYRLKEPNQPDRRRREEYYTHQEPTVLFNKLEGLFFSIDEEEQISIIDVKKRVAEQFDQNYEKVTKKFYQKFKKKHRDFRDFIEGIDGQINRDWYASLMLNRLMFIYFIQKKGFLDNDRDYLSNKLKEVQQEQGKDEFYGFYKDFLTVLFHKGLGHPDRTPELEAKLGKVPYLNGGMFDVHELEDSHPDLKIKDKAFERLFDFFDEYNWYLDTRKTATGKDINPDVIGYIFEKYINDRSEMGAYYTKEDITDYISKNCIVPWLFDEMERQYAKAFRPNGEVWVKLKDSGDTYIYDAVKVDIEEVGGNKDGVDSVEDLDIPDNIAKGLDTEAPDLLKRREDWNTPTPDQFALPTEIWRETIERWVRYFDIRSKIENGELDSINDFITYNLDIKQFVQDLIEKTDDPELVKACWKALTSVTVLDPTCGSGAFLFAALNVLEPLYEACILKMEAFVEEKGRDTYRFFGETLDDINAPEHPKQEYFIYKSIILNNLYGVDIMHEAVEIAKLRLFLKLMSTVDVDYTKENLGLEPLPDIDFNIRAGNTLVGYATKDEFEQMASGKLDFDNDKQAVLDQADLVNRTYQRFKEKQLTESYESISYRTAKEEVNRRLEELNEKLNRYLALSYLPNNYNEEMYQKWLKTHQPLHWFVEYFSIIEDQGGFNVVIGNPPYVEYSKVKKKYTLKNYKTINAGNIYANIIERSLNIQKVSDRIGMIIQLSGFSTPRMSVFKNHWLQKNQDSWLSFFDDRPGKLFNGIEHIRTAICIGKIGNRESVPATTRYNKFYSEFRSYLFDNLFYSILDNSVRSSCILKINNEIEYRITKQLWSQKNRFGYYTQKPKNSNFVFYGYGYGYFGKVLNFQSYYRSQNKDKSTGDKYLFIKSSYDRDIFVALMNSSLFYWFFTIYSDGHNFTKHVIKSVPIDYPDSKTCRKLKYLVKELMTDLKKNATRKKANYKSTGKVVYDEYNPKLSKSIIDKIDVVLAGHYELNEVELDYIINYDIKYRMGLN